MSSSQSPLVYLTIINLKNQPILFKSFCGDRAPRDQLNFHIHFYSSLDMFQDRINARKNQYLGFISSIYSTDGQYDIYGYYSCTKIKMMIIVKQKANPLEKYEDSVILQFFKGVYQLYKRDVLNPFNTEIKENRLSARFMEQLDGLVAQFRLK